MVKYTKNHNKASDRTSDTYGIAHVIERSKIVSVHSELEAYKISVWESFGADFLEYLKVTMCGSLMYAAEIKLELLVEHICKLYFGRILANYDHNYAVFLKTSLDKNARFVLQ